MARYGKEEWEDALDGSPSGIRVSRLGPMAVLDPEPLRLDGWAGSSMADCVEPLRDPNRLERWLRTNPRCRTLVVGLANRLRAKWWEDTLEVLADVSTLRPLRLLVDIRRCDREQARVLIELGAVLTAAGPFAKCMREEAMLDARTFGERLDGDRSLRRRLSIAIGVSQLSNRAGLSAAEHNVLHAHTHAKLRDLPRLLHVERTTLEKHLAAVRHKLGGVTRFDALRMASDASLDCAWWLARTVPPLVPEE